MTHGVTATERPPALMAAECAHCGLPVPASRLARDGLASFCCAGCQSVHALLREHGLERYYALRGENTLSPVAEGIGESQVTTGMPASIAA